MVDNLEVESLGNKQIKKGVVMLKKESIFAPAKGKA